MEVDLSRSHLISPVTKPTPISPTSPTCTNNSYKACTVLFQLHNRCENSLFMIFKESRCLEITDQHPFILEALSM